MDERNGKKRTEAAFAASGAVSAVGVGVEALREATRENRSGLAVRPDKRLPGLEFVPVGAAPSGGGASDPDSNPAWDLALVALLEAKTKIASRLSQVSPEKIGLVLATTKANIDALERVSDGRPCSNRARRHLQANLLAEDLAQACGARGIVRNVSLACTSGIAAIQLGARLIRRGQAQAVYVVGVDHLSAFVTSGFGALKAIDREGCRPFDANRRGLSPGESGACVVLMRSDWVEGRPVLVRGWGNSNDANHMTGPSREAEGLTRAIESALSSAGLEPRAIDYVHAHATGTVYNDAMELTALRKVFGDKVPPLSGAKGMLGHTLGAAGLIEAVQCLCALEDQFVPGTPGLECPDPMAPESLVRTPRRMEGLSKVLKLSVGFGGINSCLILGYE